MPQMHHKSSNDKVQGILNHLETLAAYLPLFVPATRPERFERAAASGAIAIIIDLEDAVPVAAKEDARRQLGSGLTDALASRIDVFVRINGFGTHWHKDDLIAIAGLPIRGVMLPKCQSADEVKSVHGHLPALSQVIALIESPAGLAHARSIAVVAERIAFGSLDYSVSINAAHTHRALAAARSELVLAAALAGRMGPIDGVTTKVSDLKQILVDCRHGVAMGMGGKLLIHPAQVAPARKAFFPSDSDLERARKIVRFEGSGAAAVDGMMVDAPVIAWARRILATAAALGNHE
jgi:citrate lyase subunit beta / citryl-CoA lyase